MATPEGAQFRVLYEKAILRSIVPLPLTPRKSTRNEPPTILNEDGHWPRAERLGYPPSLYWTCRRAGQVDGLDSYPTAADSVPKFRQNRLRIPDRAFPPLAELALADDPCSPEAQRGLWTGRRSHQLIG